MVKQILYKKLKKLYDAKDQKLNKTIQATVKLNTLQLCIELELIFRYYNYQKKDEKLWFFSTVFDSINNLEKLSN